ncbi:hypothetical protein [Paenimyroides baculatum]|nr:hypothetical protein [Paenimyroides baculatum]
MKNRIIICLVYGGILPCGGVSPSPQNQNQKSINIFFILKDKKKIA